MANRTNLLKLFQTSLPTRSRSWNSLKGASIHIETLNIMKILSKVRFVTVVKLNKRLEFFFSNRYIVC